MKDQPCPACSSRARVPVLQVQVELHSHLAPPSMCGLPGGRVTVCFGCSPFWADSGKVFEVLWLDWL